MNNLIEINDLKKIFNLSKRDELLLIENLNLNIKKNTITSIIGPSGSGKSTLLNIITFLTQIFMAIIFLKVNLSKKLTVKV